VYNAYTMSFTRRIKKGGSVYLAEVENTRIDGKVVQRHIRYIGREVDGQTVLSVSMSDVEVDEVKLFGPLLVLHHIAQAIGLPKFLGPYANEILSLVYAHCIDFQSVSQMERWFERTDLNMILNIQGLTEKRLLGALDYLENANGEKLQADIFEAVQDRYNLHPSGVVYDVTNTYLYGKHCSLGKLGHDKEGVKGRPLIQIGLAVTKEDGIPIFHRTFDGNVHDAKTLQVMMGALRRYGIKAGMLVYDRGITSGDNIADAKGLKWDTLCGVPIQDHIKRFWRQPLRNIEELMTLENRVELNKTIFYVITRPYTINGVKGELALCFNQQQQLKLRESRRSEFIDAQELLRQGKAIKAGLEKYFSANGSLIPSVIQEAEEFDGYSCIFSTCKLSKPLLVHTYFDKDVVEKAFRSIKGVVALQPIRHWLARRVIGHVFICYLSYLLLSLLKKHLRPLSMSPETALQVLDSMYKVYLRDKNNVFKISRVVNLTKLQESILKAVDKKLPRRSV
jgi:transposase